jgi:pimeloyl-ACP methyl ester carboxylesterase
MSNLIIFIHGLNGNERTWGSVPAYISTTPAGFEVARLQYSAGWKSPSNFESSAKKLLTELEKYSQHDNIFLVGYSLGGLIAREMCRQLLVAGAEKDGLLRKFRAVIAIGTPWDGAKAWRFPGFNRPLNYVLSKVTALSKISQIASPEVSFKDYEDAINTRLELQAADPSRKLTRPSIVRIKIEDDTVAASTPKYLTVDDRDGGAISGTHRRFAENAESASYIADLILRKIREVQNAANPALSTPPHVALLDQTLPKDAPPVLVLIACSRTKNTGGSLGYDSGRPASWIAEPYLRDRIVSKRSNVYGLLKDAKIVDAFEAGRNRIYSQANKSLAHGPDLGGIESIGQKSLYLPAWKRYSGQIYAPIEESTWSQHFVGQRALTVLIMSGLYGLIDAEEKIQDYDIHLSDSDRDTGQLVKTMWSDLYTETIKHYLARAFNGEKVKIFNLLCDINYVTSIEWLELPKDKCTVYHLASPQLGHVHLLPAAGTILNRLLNDPVKANTVQKEQLLNLSDFGAPPPTMSDLKIVFDRRFGDT